MNYEKPFVSQKRMSYCCRKSSVNTESIPLAGKNGRKTVNTSFSPTRSGRRMRTAMSTSYPAGHHGNALLSKFPITHSQNHDVSTYTQEKRGLLHCVIEQPGRARPLHTICVHLGLFERHRRQQLDMLTELIEREVPQDAPLLVAGDFNDWRQYAHRKLERDAGLREVFISASGRAARTFPVRFPILRLDRIYVRNLEAAQPRVLTCAPWTRLSDHAPLQIEVSA